MTIDLVYNLVRENIKLLKPYSSARDEFTSVADVYLDANENPYPLQYSRYPDPYQKDLKSSISTWRQVKEDHIFVSNGSDEVIDLLIRAFCTPQYDTIVALNPSYGMYGISAGIQNVIIRYFGLNPDFTFDVDTLLNYIQKEDKILFLCSPNNPSGNCLSVEDILKITDQFHGIVVVDEAYIDFASHESVVKKAGVIPNLVVMQTLSKAMGAAGIRLGMAFMHPQLVQILNKIKPPYNVNSVTQAIAKDRIEHIVEIDCIVQEIIAERERLASFFVDLPFVKVVFPSQANFILISVADADELYHYLLSKAIVVRNRNTQYQCAGCIRITIGTPAENKKLEEALIMYGKINYKG